MGRAPFGSLRCCGGPRSSRPSIGSIFAGDGKYSEEIWTKVQDFTLLAFGKGVEKDLARTASGF